MGLFGKLFGGAKEDYPALDPSLPSFASLQKFHAQIEALANKVNDRIEAVPANDVVYLFIGKPPGMFGIAWFTESDPGEHNLKTLMQKKGLSQRRVDAIMSKLRTAYTEIENEPRYTAVVGSQKVIVTPSQAFAENVHKIVHVVEE